MATTMGRRGIKTVRSRQAMAAKRFAAIVFVAGQPGRWGPPPLACWPRIFGISELAGDLLAKVLIPEILAANIDSFGIRGGFC